MHLQVSLQVSVQVDGASTSAGCGDARAIHGLGASATVYHHVRFGDVLQLVVPLVDALEAHLGQKVSLKVLLVESLAVPSVHGVDGACSSAGGAGVCLGASARTLGMLFVGTSAVASTGTVFTGTASISAIGPSAISCNSAAAGGRGAASASAVGKGP